MTYLFLQQAQAQPDLADFCEYLKKPLMVLEDIQIRYEALQLTKKVDSENLEIYHKCDSILNKHLPQMLDNFCNSSFEYRNKEKIKVNNRSLTPKELLLENLAKIIEEVKLIEQDFNRNNSFNAIVHNKVLQNYGFQPELSLETGKIVKNHIELDNRFDYDNFIENNQFKKPIAKTEVNFDSVEEKVEEFVKAEKAEPRLRFIDAIIMIGIVSAVAAIMTLAMNDKNAKYEQRVITNEVLNIQKSIQENYKKDKDYSKVRDADLLAIKTSKESKGYKSNWREHIHVSPTTINTKNDSFAIEFNSGKEDYKFACDVVYNLVDNFSMTKVNDQYEILKGDQNNKDAFKRFCKNKDYSSKTPQKFQLITKHN